MIYYGEYTWLKNEAYSYQAARVENRRHLVNSKRRVCTTYVDRTNKYVSIYASFCL